MIHRDLTGYLGIVRVFHFHINSLSQLTFDQSDAHSMVIRYALLALARGKASWNTFLEAFLNNGSDDVFEAVHALINRRNRSRSDDNLYLLLSLILSLIKRASFSVGKYEPIMDGGTSSHALP